MRRPRSIPTRPRIVRWLRGIGRRRPRSHRDVFIEIYRRRVWANDETVSGRGSTRARASAFRGDLERLLADLDVRLLLDAGCGDFNWMDDVSATVPTYIGVEVVPQLVARLERDHAQAGRTFLCADVRSAPLPRADVILCRDCLVHFSFRDIDAALSNFARSGSTYLLTTTFLDVDHNEDIQTGGWRALNLQRPPFSFPPPRALIDERCVHSEGRYRGKRIGLWELSSLPLRNPGPEE